MKYAIALLVLMLCVGTVDAQDCNRRPGHLLFAPARVTLRVLTIVPRAIHNHRSTGTASFGQSTVIQSQSSYSSKTVVSTPALQVVPCPGGVCPLPSPVTPTTPTPSKHPHKK